MSTYLVAFVVSNYKTISATSKGGVLVEVAGRPEAIDAGDGQFALEEALTYIDFLTEYFNVSFPLKKLSKPKIIYIVYKKLIWLLIYKFFKLTLEFRIF